MRKHNKRIKTPILVVNNMNQNSFSVYSHDIVENVCIVINILIYAEEFEVTLYL